jgi:hypothetical protein
MAAREGSVEVEPWDTEWAAQKAAEALRYLERNYPECLENLRALDEHGWPPTRPRCAAMRTHTSRP